MSRVRRGLLSAAVLTAASIVGAVPVAAARPANHCVNPAGADLNAVYQTNDAFITPFCTDAHSGDWWRPLLRWLGAATHDVIPEGYIPSGATPRADFLGKLQSARYVVDAGTARERSYTVEVRRLIIATGEVPDGTEFVAFTPRLHPLPPGAHTVDIYVTLSEENWDGLGLEPENHSAAGESLVSSVAFVVHKRSA